MKTKLSAFVLATLMAFSLAVSPAAAASTNPVAGNPYAPTTLTDGTVVVEQRPGSNATLIHAFLYPQTVVTMDEQFVLNYTDTTSGAKRGFSSQTGYEQFVGNTVNWLIQRKLVTRVSDGKSCTYGADAIKLSTTSEEPMAISYLLNNYFRVPASVEPLATVSHERTYQNRTTTTYANVRSYSKTGEPLNPNNPLFPDNPNYPNVTPPISDPDSYACDIWAVRDLDDGRIEVYLRNGMIVRLEKAMIVDWVDSRNRSSREFGLSYWYNDPGMNDEGAKLCVDFCQDLLDALVLQGWTVYPPDEALKPGYSYRKFPVEDVMWANVTTDQVLMRSLERVRSADTTAEMKIYFDWYDNRGQVDHWVSYPMSFEFMLRDDDTASGFNFWAMTRSEHFVRCFNKAQDFWLSWSDLQAIRR